MILAIAGAARNIKNATELKKMKYNKLIRDKILERIIDNGGHPITHIADKEEYWRKLKCKLVEEVDEFRKDESIEELADILKVH